VDDICVVRLRPFTARESFYSSSDAVSNWLECSPSHEISFVALNKEHRICDQHALITA
jgi:hypothetical protein